jgi:hypothetical protein
MEKPAQNLVEHFKSFYRQFHQSNLCDLRKLYASDAVFKDPVHEIRGLVAIEDYMAGLMRELSDCRFEYLDEVVGNNQAYIKWVMHFRHRKLGNRLISVRGVSHIQFEDQVTFQEDVYDLGAMLYEQLPVLGPVIRWLRRRLARQD